MMKRWFVVFMLSVLSAACSENDTWHTKKVTGLLPPLEFQLTDENGKSVTQDNYLGKVTLVFFGYTNCPDICPLTLAKLRMAMKQLDEEERAESQVLFISVDPQRDDNEQLKRYTKSFGENFIGLTGTTEQLVAVTKRFRTTFSYDQPDAQGDYLVSHSSAAFAFSPDGEAQLLIRDESAEEIAEDLQHLI